MRRLELRIAENDRALIEKAAQLQGLSVSAFMRQSALELARRKINKHNKEVKS